MDHILIKPTWEEIPEEHKDKLLIQIDPGTAFGTGKHETTQLCIRQLEKYVKPGVKVLDLGTGSGILGIAALKLGADYVFELILMRTRSPQSMKTWLPTISRRRSSA